MPQRRQQRATARGVRCGSGERTRLPGAGRRLRRRCRGHDQAQGGDRAGGLGRSAGASRSVFRTADPRPCAAAGARPVGLMASPTTNLDGEIRDGRHVMPVRVYYEDTDFSGIVYRANYLRFMERGRTNFLRLLGADQRGLFEQTAQEAPGFAFVVRSMQIEFLKPARMDDVLKIE